LKPKYIDLYMDWAARAAELSHARRLHVGAVIVKDDTVISYGYNGMPAGWDNNCEDTIFVHDIGAQSDDTMIEDGFSKTEVSNWIKLKTKPEVLHAESNAIAKLARSNNSGRDADIFITHAPCLDCAKLIYQSGIRRVWFGQAYRDTTGIEFLQRSGIEVTQHDNTKV
jgi:dCMP deaminase